MTQTQKQQRLRELMQAHSLTYAGLAELASVSTKTVEGWLADSRAASHRSISRAHLDLIELRLKKRRKGGKA